MNISIDLANKILGYLATKPYIEVAELINGLQLSATKEPVKENKNDTKNK